jgi:hypothetical protein
VGNFYALIAFALLWLSLASLFVLLMRTLVIQSRRRRRGEPGVWEHGL